MFQWKPDIKIVSLGSCSGMFPPATGKNEFWLLGQDRGGRAMLCQPRGFDKDQGC